MTHDPMCPCAPINPIRPGAVHTTNTASCQCVRLIQARADERKKTIIDCIEIVKGADRRSADNGFSRVGPFEIIAAMRALQRKS